MRLGGTLWHIRGAERRRRGGAPGREVPRARSLKCRAAFAAVMLALSLTLGACVTEPRYYGGMVLGAPARIPLTAGA